MESTRSEPTGPRPTDTDHDSDLRDVVLSAWDGGFSLQSDFARKHAAHVARAASCGYITTLTPNGDFGYRWRVTRAGMALLEGQA